MKPKVFNCCVCSLDGKPKAAKYLCDRIKLNKNLYKILSPDSFKGCSFCLHYVNEQYFKSTKIKY